MENRKVLWSNDTWTIESFDMGTVKNRIMIYTEGRNFHIDYPIQYDNGDVAFENPYMVPQYIQKKVAALYRKIRK